MRRYKSNKQIFNMFNMFYIKSISVQCTAIPPELKPEPKPDPDLCTSNEERYL